MSCGSAYRKKNDENYTKCLDSSKPKTRSGCVHAMNTYGGMEV